MDLVECIDRLRIDHSDRMYINSIVLQYYLLPYQVKEAEQKFKLIKVHLLSREGTEYETASILARPRFLNWLVANYRKKDDIVPIRPIID